MPIQAHYRGREQSFFKHALLKAYLERLFMIVGQYHRTICYVDCFAGPWQSRSDVLEDTSIAASLDIINKCREGLQRLGHAVHFKAIFIEKDTNAFTKLNNYLASRHDDAIETTALHGEFFHLRQELLMRCGDSSFAFFFVDPTGWKKAVELPTLAPLLQRPNSEFLINFMYDFLLRTHTQESFAADMWKIFGEVPNTEGMDPEIRETRLIRLYRNNLKTVAPVRGGKPRTACVKVHKILQDRTLYHLVYLTRHPKGIVEFMAASEGLDLVQRKIRAIAKQEERVERKGQFELFAAHEEIKVQDDRVDRFDVKAYWLDKLSTTPRQFGPDDLADMLEETDWFASDFQKAFKELESAGRVKNLDAKRTRPVNAVNFEKGEHLVKLT